MDSHAWKKGSKGFPAMFVSPPPAIEEQLEVPKDYSGRRETEAAPLLETPRDPTATDTRKAVGARWKRLVSGLLGLIGS